MDFYQFYTGHSFDAHQFLGAHLTADGAVFRTFAPAADKIDLRLWQEDGEKTVPMHEIYDGNFYECEVAGAAPGDYYAYEIYHGGQLRRALRSLRLRHGAAAGAPLGDPGSRRLHL
ncbi:MAG: GlgB N-terminal domain-containing protein [Pseudoramibacter sp.]